jgi:hypothetical protein
MRFIFSFLFLVVLFTASGQSNEGNISDEKKEYLEKIRKQRKISKVLVTTGVVVFTSGLALSFSQLISAFMGGQVGNADLVKAGEVMLYSGVGLLIVSLPIEISYRRKIKRAASISLERKHFGYPGQGPIPLSSFSAISIKIALSR